MEAETNSPGFWNWFRDRWLVVAALGVLLALTSALVTATIFAPKSNSGAPAPGFELRDEQGRLTSLAQFRGKVVLLTFIDPYCTQICPLTTQSMLQAQRLLGPAAAAKVQLLGINVNPDKTGISDVAAYTRAHDMEGRWLFLTGSRAQLEKVWHGYHVYVTATDNDVEHEAVVYLIDGRGRERAVYSTSMSYGDVGEQARTLAKAISNLLPGGLAVLRDASLKQTAPLTPADMAPLRALGTDRSDVVLGREHARLLCFFASWLGETANLPANLAELDAYDAQARRHGWPAPVAVDEMTTETSPADARQLLAGIAATLQTPIVEDADGRLADGYQVEELPWYVLTSPSGKIIWRHDGWLSTAELIKGVRGAVAAK